MTYSPPQLTIKLRTGVKQTFTYDFTRFFYKGVAFKRNLQHAENLQIEIPMLLDGTEYSARQMNTRI